MDALALDAGGYTGTYKLVGGRVSLDLVNTVSWPGTAREHDWLDRAGNVVEWAVAAGILTRTAAESLSAQEDADSSGAATSLTTVHRHRRVVAGVLGPVARGRPPAPADVEALNELVAMASVHRAIDPSSLTWGWSPPTRLQDITRPVVIDAASVVTDSDHSRLGHCPACGWLFYDHTRNRSRRWCDMADCGSRQKARRYYNRQRESRG